MSSSNGIHQMHQLDTMTALWIRTLGVSPTRIQALPTPSYPSPSSRLFDSQETSSLHSFFFAPETSVAVGSRRKPVVTYPLLQQLPSSLSRDSLLSSLKSTLNLHPICFFHYEIEARMRALDDPINSLSPVTSIQVSFFAVVAASMTLGALAYHVERKAWKMQSEIPESERDLTKLFDMTRLAIALSGDTDDDRLDVLLALLILIVFTLHSLELDGYQAVLSGVAPSALQQQLRSLLDSMRQKAEISGLLIEPLNNHTASSVWTRERRRMLAAAVAFYDFHVSDLIGNKITLDAASYTAEPPTPLDDRTFKPSCTTIPPPASSINHSTIFATHRARLLKSLLQARMEIVFMRDQERDLMIAAAEKAENNTGEDKSTQPSLPRSAGDTLEQWDERLHQQQGNLPHSIAFDTSAEYATDVAIVFAGEQRPPGPYETSVSLATGYSIAQQTELAALTSYYQMRFAALLLENALIYKPRGSPPSANGTVAAIRTLDAAQALLHVIKVQRHVLKKKMPLCLSNYVYGKRIFDAGVIFGVLCTLPATRGYERRSLMDAANGLHQCILLLKDLETWMRLKEGVPEMTVQPALQELSPPLRVLEELADRAGIQVIDGIVESVVPKRKRGAFELEDIQSLFDGLILPYVVGGVWVVGQPSKPVPWSSHVEEVVPVPIPTAPLAVAPPVPAAEDEHHDKRVRLEGIVVEPVDPFARADPKLAFMDRATPGGAQRPSSATNTRRRIAVRARIQDQLTAKRPKRRVDADKSKSSSPSSSNEEENAKRFAFSIPEEPTEYQQQYALSQYSTQPSNDLGLHLAHSETKPVAPPNVANGEPGHDTPVTDSGSSVESAQAGVTHGYNQAGWQEMQDAAAYNQQMLQSHAYAHQTHTSTVQRSQQQHQQYQHAPVHVPQHPQLQSSYAQSHASMPHEYQVSHSQPPPAHPAHLQYPQGYGYSGTESSGRSHPQLVIDTSFSAGTQAQVSQPPSAVAMGEGGVFYTNGLTIQPIGPGSIYQTPQEQYARSWASTDNYHYGGY
ncbi:hypothetical protein PIIN_06182 [Serendipita indica DSM 11827]|uniref:Uncharacterized protein n=1 Tax=Serendipita indica (strain DSM 11827) TaxID=1109443 RepID=G4TLQ5_SERID|nr:hypothetical protein PIIN_06182 [Serendipita indica DSM 11827]